MIAKMAWRNIWRNKMRSIVIMLSIAVGLFAGIMVMALYNGMMNGRINIVINNEVGNIQVHHPEFKKDYEPFYIIPEPGKLVEELRKNPSVKTYTSRSITQGMLSTTTGSAGIQINGIIPDQEDKVSQLYKKIIVGKSFRAGKTNEVLIGKKLSVKMKLKTGSKLVLTFTDSAYNIVSAAFRVAGIYESDNAPLDERNVYVRQNELNTMLGIGESFHEIVILLNNSQETESVKAALKQEFSEYQIESWKEISLETKLLVDTIDSLSYIIILIILFALAFGIINTMLMAILERTREIGMMMALGVTKTRLFLLILSETLILTIAGTPVGFVISWGLVAYFNKHGLDWSGMGKDLIKSFGFDAIVYPEFPAEKLVTILIFVIGTAILSCLYPAYKALQLQPVDALRK
jgi:ABC-type lipoprotein release transport system permease subunit